MCDPGQMLGLKAGDDQLGAAKQATADAQKLADQALADRKAAADAAAQAAAGDPESARLKAEARMRQLLQEQGPGALFSAAPSQAPVGYRTAMGQ